jgi:hypothetical protein
MIRRFDYQPYELRHLALMNLLLGMIALNPHHDDKVI